MDRTKMRTSIAWSREEIARIVLQVIDGTHGEAADQAKELNRTDWQEAVAVADAVLALLTTAEGEDQSATPSGSGSCASTEPQSVSAFGFDPLRKEAAQCRGEK